MADPPPPLALSITSASPNPSATLWFWGARTGSPLAGSDPKGPTRCCGTAVQLGTISRRKLAGSPLRSLFVSVSDPCPALHIPNAGGTAALSPSTPISMTPKFQLPAYPILRPTTCQVPPQHPLHTAGPGSPQSPPPPGTECGAWRPRRPWARPARAYLSGPLCRRALVQLRVPARRPQPEPPYGPQGPRPPLARSRWVLESAAATPHPRGSSPSPMPLGLGLVLVK